MRFGERHATTVCESRVVCAVTRLQACFTYLLSGMCSGPPYAYDRSSSYSASFSAAASSTALFRSRTRCLCTTRSRSSSGIPSF